MARKRIAIVFFSAAGTMARLAEAARVGVEDAGAEALMLPILPKRIIDGRFVDEALLRACDEADALVFGTPTYMGGPAAQFKAFADATGDRWAEQRWTGKLAAGMTSGACTNGDQGHTLAYFTVLASQHGMLWCGLDIPGGLDAEGRNRSGTQLGASAQAEAHGPHPADLATARHLGRRLAKLCVRLE